MKIRTTLLIDNMSYLIENKLQDHKQHLISNSETHLPKHNHNILAQTYHGSMHKPISQKTPYANPNIQVFHEPQLLAHAMFSSAFISLLTCRNLGIISLDLLHTGWSYQSKNYIHRHPNVMGR